MRNPLVAGLAVLAATATLTGCGGGGGTKTATTPDTGTSGNTILIKSFTFRPGTLNVKVGQAITVTNKDSSTHTFTASDKSFDSGGLGEGKTYTFTPTKAGTFAYICTIHQYMHGTLVVS